MTKSIRLVLVNPEIPANTGNIVRLCAATGVFLHLIEPLGFSLADRVLKRAGLDYWKHCQMATHLTFEDLEAGFPDARFLFLTKKAPASFFNAQILTGDMLVLGPESTGLTDRFLSRNDRMLHRFRIPMPGNARSLNLSTAAGIVVYESLRQLNRLT